MSISLLSLKPAKKTNLTGWLGIDIGSTAVKIAQVRQKGETWELLSAQLFPVTEDSNPLETAVEGVESLSGTKSKWFGKQAACITTESPDIRSLDVPNASRGDINGYLAQQPGLAGLKLSTIVWPSTWKVSPTDNLPCHVYGIHEPTTDIICERLFDQGAHCQVMESLPHSLARLMKFSPKSSNKVQGIIDWSAKHPLFVLVRNGDPYYTRLLKNCSFGKAVSEMSKKLDLCAQDAWNLLSGIGSATTGRTDLPSLSNTINELTQTTRHQFLAEINRTLSFLRSENQELVPSKLWLVGVGASFPGISELLSEETKLPTEGWYLPTATPQANIANSGKYTTFASAISLSAIPLLS